MTQEQINEIGYLKSRIKDLDWWLARHHNDPYYSEVLHDKLQHEEKLKTLEKTNDDNR